MHQAMYEELKRVAARGETATYSEVAPLISIWMTRVTEMKLAGCSVRYLSMSTACGGHSYQSS